jgi:hypothetical protein
MTRSVLAVLLVALFIVGLGVFVSGRLEAPETTGGEDSLSLSKPATKAPAEPSPAPPAIAPTTKSEPPAAVSSAVVVSLKGTVETRRETSAWQALRPDAMLSENDVVRTGRRAEVTLRFDDSVEVRLSPRSELTIRELSAAVSRVRLDQGHVTAVVGSAGRILRVQVRNADAEVQSAQGSFGITTDGNGQLAVAATTGRVVVDTPQATVEVPEGQQTTVAAHEAPATPTALPASLFLKVAALATTQTNQTTTTVRGTTSPGALVRVGEEVAPADESGGFAVKVPLQEGRNELRVEVVDPTGRRHDEILPPITVDRSKPPIDAAIQWGRRE